MRIHRRDRSALWFGPPAGSGPVHRFDDPLGKFKVCYFGTTADACFAETFLRNPPVRILGLDDLAARRVAIVEVQRELRMVQFHGPGLARLGTTAEPTVGADYAVSQALSRALWQHGDMPDGIVYRSRHDDSGLCLASYDRIEDHLTVVAGDFLTADSRLLGRLLKRYDLGLTR